MRLPALLFVSGFLAAQAPTPPETALTVDQVVAKVLDARGGIARLHAVQSRRITGHIEGLPSPITFDQLNARPDRIRLTLRTEAQAAAGGQSAQPASTQVKTFDGKAGWAWSNSEVPRTLAPEEIQVLDADFDGPLVDFAAKGNQVAYLGLQTFQNQKALVLKVTLKDKRIQTMYFDPKTFLKFSQVNGEGKAGVELDFWDYNEVDSLPMAYTVIIGPVSVRVDKITLNVPVTDADFLPPKK
ncbi:MAG: hypothetical protein JST24_10855 [Acidobacteria bacterium]|nr:hypothetical protein [Acidobacteriota bacterium]